jgi:hypothetical protein
VLLHTIALIACGEAEDPLASADVQYLEIAAELAVADRDTARNVQSREARARKVEQEQARVAFFRDPKVAASIDLARKSPDPEIARRGEAYWRQAIFIRSWTEQEKARETELLASIEESRAGESSWSSEEGETFDLRGRWGSVSADADSLSELQRAELASAWADQRTGWLGEDLVALVTLRNEVARREGFDSYWELALAHRGLDAEDVESMLDEVESLVQPLNAAASQQAAAKAVELGLEAAFHNDPMLRRAAGLTLDDSGEGWFDADLAEERVLTALSDVGLPVTGMQIYVGPSRYARSGAYSFAIRPPEHAAVVVSSDRRWSDWPYRALLHEVGLATWWRSLPAEAAASPPLWSPATPWFEGYGDLFEHMLYQEAFLAKYVPELPAEERASYAASHEQSQLESLTWYLGCTRAEQALYTSPGDYKKLSASLAAQERELRGWGFDGPMGDEVAWTSFLQSGLMLNYPGYVQNFLYSAATEATLWEAATEAVGDPVANPSLGPWLVSSVVEPVAGGQPFAEVLSGLSGGAKRTAALERSLAP